MSVEQMMTVQQMETPHSSVGSFTLPCGYIDAEGKLHKQVDVREIRGYEEDMLASEQVPAESKIDLLIGGCLTRIGDISDPAKIKYLVPELAVGDRVMLLFAIRRVTLGDSLPVRETCPKCDSSTLFTINLGELDVVPMKDPFQRVYDTTLPSGLAVRYRLAVGSDDLRLRKILAGNKTDKMSAMMLMRLELINGKRPELVDLKELGMKDRMALRDALKENDGGVDTTLELECPSCQYEWKKELNIVARDFFFPSETPKP